MHYYYLLATSASDQVVKHPVSEGGDTKPKPPEKKKWGGPSDTLLSNLEKKLGEGAGSGEGSSKPSVPEKKKWAGPSDTLLNALAQKSVVSGTLSGESSGKFYFFLFLSCKGFKRKNNFSFTFGSVQSCSVCLSWLEIVKKCHTQILH